MVTLEELEGDFPLLDFDFRRFCSSLGIITVEDFLLHDSLALELELKHAPEKLKQGVEQLFSIVDDYHHPFLTGLELLDDDERNKGFLSTGCGRIDVLLQGGLRLGHVTEIVGPSSSGKTQFCLRTASHVARNFDGEVLYFDTGNSCSARRISQFLNQFTVPANNEVKKTVKQAMCSIVRHCVFDIFKLLDMLHQLLMNKSNTQAQSPFVKMLIIDSVSSLISPILGGGNPQGHSVMIRMGFMLKKLAYERNISVVVTNHMVGGQGGASKPALGESWKSVPHVRLLLSATPGSSITILKHPFLAAGKWTTF